MADPPKLRALKALSALIKTVTPENGYTHDLSNKVFRGRFLFGAEAPSELINIVESPRPERASYGGELGEINRQDWPLWVQGIARDDSVNPTDPLYRLMAEVETCLMQIISTNAHSGEPMFPEVFLLGGLITGFEMGPGIVRPPGELSAKAFFYLPIRVGVASGAD